MAGPVVVWVMTAVVAVDGEDEAALDAVVVSHQTSTETSIIDI